jgi:hypothetical protein
MFANWYEIYVQMKTREKALLAEAAGRRLLASLPSAGQRRPGAVGQRLLAALGRLLVRWGSSLQGRHGHADMPPWLRSTRPLVP